MSSSATGAICADEGVEASLTFPLRHMTTRRLNDKLIGASPGLHRDQFLTKLVRRRLRRMTPSQSCDPVSDLRLASSHREWNRECDPAWDM